MVISERILLDIISIDILENEDVGKILKIVWKDGTLELIIKNINGIVVFSKVKRLLIF